MAAQTSTEPFPALPSALGIHSRFCDTEPIVLVMRSDNSFSGGDYNVCTYDKRQVIRCKGKTMSLSNRREITTADGEPLYTLRKETFSIPRSYYLESPTGERLLQLNARFALLSPPKLDVQFKNVLGGGEDVKLKIKGTFFNRFCDITWNDLLVARVRQKFWDMGNLFGRQTYGVEVAPNVDLALISAIVIGFEEYQEEKS